jgi:hypothetical protein
MITIPTKLAKQDAVFRLERLIQVSSKTHRFSGEISGSSFRLMCSQSVGNSAVRPEFSGIVEATSSGSEVKGDFQFSKSARRFLSSWFVFGTLWTVGAGVSVAHQPVPPVLKILPMAGVGMLVIGVVFVRFAKSYYRDDQTRLTRAISDELNG